MQAEQQGGKALIQQKISERMIPCLNESNPNYSRNFLKNCKIMNIGSKTKTQLCGEIRRIAVEDTQENNRRAIEKP